MRVPDQITCTRLTAIWQVLPKQMKPARHQVTERAPPHGERLKLHQIRERLDGGWGAAPEMSSAPEGDKSTTTGDRDMEITCTSVHLTPLCLRLGVTCRG